MTEAPTYRITTWDVEAQDFTAQEGIAEYVRGISGLLKVIRLLKDQGYPCDRNSFSSDPSVYIQRVLTPKQ